MIPEDIEAEVTRIERVITALHRTWLTGAAVLVVVWLNGLEVLNRDLGRLVTEFSENNRQKQQVEYDLRAIPAEALALGRRRAGLETWAHALQTLPKQLKGDLASARNEKQRTEIRKAFDRLARSADDYQKARTSFEVAQRAHERRAQSIQARREELSYARALLATQRESLRERSEGVSFEVLGQKFALPRFYAPITWVVGLFGLVVATRTARRNLLRFMTRISGSATTEGDGAMIQRQIRRVLPWWIHPLPARLANARDREQSWLEKQESLVVVAVALVLLTLLRVLWVALAIAGVSGSNSERLLTYLLVIVATGIVALVIWLWTEDTERPDSSPSWLSPGYFLPCVAVVTSCGFALYSISPAVADVWLPQAAHLAIVVAAVFVVIASSWMLVATWNGRQTATSFVNQSRRFLMLSMAAALVVGFGTVIRPSRRRGGTKSEGHPRQSTDEALAEGFYVRQPSATPLRFPSSRPQIVHYARTDGFACGAKIDKGRLRANSFELTELLHGEAPPIALHAACCYPAIEHRITDMLQRRLTFPTRRRAPAVGETELSILLEVIRRELRFSAASGKSPSVRLADLCAATAVRLRRPDVLEQLQQELRDSGHAELLSLRIEKWTDERSAWYVRWRDQRRRMKWGRPTGVVF